MKKERVLNAGCGESLLFETGEHRFWTAVLETWIHDAKKVQTLTRADQLREQCFTRRTKWICQLIDIDYEWFKKSIETLLLKSLKEKNSLH